MSEEKEIMIQSIEQGIEKTKAQLRAQEMLLKELTTEPTIPFVATKIGRNLNAALAWITKPFSDVHNYAHVAATDPESYVICKALADADDVVAEATMCPNREHKLARKLTLKAARTRLEISRWENNEMFTKRIQALQNLLQVEITRLRPEKANPKIAEDVSNFLKNAENSNAEAGV